MSLRRAKQPGLFDLFTAGDSFLSAPDTAALKSAIIGAIDNSTGEPVVLKYWEKTGSPIDKDLSEIWRHEMRQADRVRAYPGADEVVVQVEASGETADAFFFAMPADLAPLNRAIQLNRLDHWLRNLSAPRRRIVLWKNIRRLAVALGAVHGQGLVHGRIGPSAVFTAARDIADFRLGGFEWCVRIADVSNAPIGRIAVNRGTPVILSFVDDWRALGKLVANLLGIDQTSLDEEEVIFDNGYPSLSLYPAEVDIIRWMFERERHREIDSEVVCKRIDAILEELEVGALEDNGRYVLTLRLGEKSKLTAILRSISDDAFDPEEVDKQIEFVRSDFSTGVDLVRMADGGLVLETETLAYILRPMRQPQIEETWQVASCDLAKLRAEFFAGRRTVTTLPANRIEIIRYAVAARRLQELRADALDWTRAFSEEGVVEDPSLTIRRGLLLAQVTEALFRVAEIIPVSIVEKGRAGGAQTVQLAARVEGQRARLMEALGVAGPGPLLRRLFEQEQADIDATWELSESGSLGRSGRHNAGVRFLRTVRKDDRRLYEFRCDGVLPPTAYLYLRQADDAGTDGALRRRLRMLATLATQQELSVMLDNPRARLRTYRDPLVEDAAFAKLDDSKQAALRSIWTTGPGQFVVGPPGVGKTRLVAEIVRRVLAEDPTARLLLSAQAHQALDHLAASVQSELKDAPFADEILLVRSKSDSAADLSGAQAPERVKKYLASLNDSRLVKGAPIELQNALTAMAAAKDGSRDEADTEGRRQRRSFEALVLQSASVLFSTTNSGDLARLVEDRAQFDWVIVEEAAKATGSELLPPLLLSMRRLLIGDHNQLPPFDTDRIINVLSDQTRVHAAISESDIFIGSVFRDYGLEDLREAIADPQGLSRISESARKAVLLFESLVKQEIQKQEKPDRRRKQVAIELREQHRMHPAIATVISECFYPDKLETSAKRAQEFESEAPPFIITKSWLPDSPIVIVDMPFIQREKGAAEQLPVYHNPAEVRAVKAVLAALQPAVPKTANDGTPTLAVLSPYNEQAERLGLAIEDWLSGPLPMLNGFARPRTTGGFEGTVDSFQGSEADVVVISLVRNNEHTAGRALGFLNKPRRMNVLLSRAKWKLVIVTSFEFLRVHGRRYTGRGSGSEQIFLPTLIDVLDRLRNETLADGATAKVSVVPWNEVEQYVP